MAKGRSRSLGRDSPEPYSMSWLGGRSWFTTPKVKPGQTVCVLSQWLLPHWQKEWFVARAVLRYRRFLHLRTLYPGVLLIPPLDVELVILAHKVWCLMV